MKKIYLSIVILALFGLTSKVEAQCDLSIANLQIQIVGTPVTLGPNKCEVTFNVQFDIATNSGFKVLYFHSWLAEDYPASPIFDCGNSNAQDAGTATQLGTAVDQVGKSFLDIGFTNVPVSGALNVVQPLTFSTNYVHDQSVVLTMPSNSPGMTAEKYFNGTYDHYTVNNIKVIINKSCSSTIAVKTDIWGSNANAPDPKAQCYICALPQFFNDPQIAGLKNCDNPRKYTIGITTVDPVAKNVFYHVYLDVNNNGTIDVGDLLAFTSGTISISQGTPYSSGLVALPSPYSDTKPYADYNYIIKVSGASLSNSVVKALPDPACIPLPVNFKSFTAVRRNMNVELNWVTASEKNSKGFAIERSLDNTNWQQIGYVLSKARGGNSDLELSYQYSDINNSKGIAQYRIKQIDFDNRSKFSPIRSVAGIGQDRKIIVYPNPSSDGTVNIVFEDVNVSHDIIVQDMYGRVIKNMYNVREGSTQINNLKSGMFIIRVINKETGIRSFQKIVVK